MAAYTYDPFGNVTEMVGAEAEGNPWRFSTKPMEVGTGWLYYGYRWLNTETARWVSRDPIEERGGVNLYGFLLGNRLITRTDLLGLKCQCGPDITEALRNTFKAIGSAFRSLSPNDRDSVCKTLWGR